MAQVRQQFSLNFRQSLSNRREDWQRPVDSRDGCKQGCRKMAQSAHHRHAELVYCSILNQSRHVMRWLGWHHAPRKWLR
jgi:hypothetical protein